MTARFWARVVLATCTASVLGTAVLVALGIGRTTPGDGSGLGGWGGLGFALAALAFGGVGSLIASRLPENRVGWVFCVTGVALGTGDLAYQYADQVLYGSLQSWPGGATAAVVQTVDSTSTFGLLAVAVLLFPHGTVHERRWQLALALPLTGIACGFIGFALRPGPLDAPFGTVRNPLGVPGAFGLTDALTGFGWIFMALGVALAAVAIRSRLKRSHGTEHEQLKWLAFAAAVTGAMIVGVVLSYFVSSEGFNQLRSVALAIGFAAFPIAAGVAILRYRLYDIDVVINRTLVYAALTATLAGVYVGSILLLQLVLSAFTAGSGLAVAASTLATAALVRPARARIQQLVDRRFFRRKYDAARTLERFGAHVRSEVDLDAVTAELRAVVAETMQPAHLTLWVPGTSSMTSSRNDSRTQNR